MALSYLMNSHLTQLCKEHYDKAYKEENWELIRHHIIRLENQRPAIACSQLFSVDYIRFRDDILRIVLNIFPLSNSETVIIFSFTESEEDLAVNYLQSKVYGEKNILKYFLSKLVIENTSNFFISPLIFGKWSQEKKSDILQYFEETIFEFKDEHSKNFYLFE